jgi:hypothetical protein
LEEEQEEGGEENKKTTTTTPSSIRSAGLPEDWHDYWKDAHKTSKN